jgi:glycosyltransferase involved in cell wall biosynthesis
MASSVKVSVITPSLNQGEFIEETIQSVLNQTYPNIEYIVVDGGSTDATVDILGKYRGRFKLIQGQDRGQTDAINIGMRASTGELVGWLNSDDVYERDCVEKIVARYLERSSASIYYGAIRLINKAGYFVGFLKWGPLTYERLLRGLPAVWQPGSFYPLDLVREVGYLDADLLMTMDADLYLKLLRIAPAEFVPEFVARRRAHVSTKTSRYLAVAVREGLKIRVRQGAPFSAVLSYCLRRVAYLAKFYIINTGNIIRWSHARKHVGPKLLP